MAVNVCLTKCRLRPNCAAMPLLAPWEAVSEGLTNQRWQVHLYLAPSRSHQRRWGSPSWRVAARGAVARSETSQPKMPNTIDAKHTKALLLSRRGCRGCKGGRPPVSHLVKRRLRQFWQARRRDVWKHSSEWRRWYSLQVAADLQRV